MAAPADRLANIVYQDTNKNVLPKLEHLAHRYNRKVWSTYPYKDQRDVTGTVEVWPETNSATVMNARKLRAIGCLLNVPWNTSYAQTRTDIGTAIAAL